MKDCFFYIIFFFYNILSTGIIIFKLSELSRKNRILHIFEK